MAKQRGFLKLEGTIGDVSFMKTRDGFIAKEKTSIPASRIATDPAFARTRENGAEFANAGISGRMLRSAFSEDIKRAKDRRMISRLQKTMMQVVKSDTQSLRGERKAAKGNLALLQDFEFNGGAQLSNSLLKPFSAQIDRVNGEATVVIPSLVPSDSIQFPAGATHYQIRSFAGWVDFTTGEYKSGGVETAVLPNEPVATDPVSLVTPLEDAGTHPVFLLVGIEFTQEVNGVYYPLKNGTYNSLKIVLVDQEG